MNRANFATRPPIRIAPLDELCRWRSQSRNELGHLSFGLAQVLSRAEGQRMCRSRFTAPDGKRAWCKSERCLNGYSTQGERDMSLGQPVGAAQPKHRLPAEKASASPHITQSCAWGCRVWEIHRFGVQPTARSSAQREGVGTLCLVFFRLGCRSPTHGAGVSSRDTAVGTVIKRSYH